MVRMTPLAAAAALACFGPPALGQGRAEGRYPALLSCDALPFTAGPLRDPFMLEISSGKAAYSRRLPAADAPDAAGGTETGTGTLAGGRLSLTGKGVGKGSGVGDGNGRAASFESRYLGEVSGMGGLLTGIQSWTYRGRSYERRCQISVGNGRG